MKQLATHSTVTTSLLEKVMALSWQDGPPDLSFLIKQCLLDWLGVSVAAAADPPVQVLREALEEQGGHPQSSVFGSLNKCLPTQQAALLNGTISHLLDYDDVNLTLPSHVSFKTPNPLASMVPGANESPSACEDTTTNPYR
jgi:2-methylcitrate dehydratase PrpD